MLLSVFPVCVVPVILPLIKVLLGSKRQALNFLVKLVFSYTRTDSSQFRTDTFRSL